MVHPRRKRWGKRGWDKSNRWGKNLPCTYATCSFGQELQIVKEPFIPFEPNSRYGWTGGTVSRNGWTTSNSAQALASVRPPRKTRRRDDAPTPTPCCGDRPFFRKGFWVGPESGRGSRVFLQDAGLDLQSHSWTSGLSGYVPWIALDLQTCKEGDMGKGGRRLL